MVSDPATDRARVREECLSLSPEDDTFDAGALEERLRKLLAMVERLPRTAAEIESAAKRTKESAGTRVFNIYELAELVLEDLELKDIIQAQNINRKTREVVRSSLRIVKNYAALNTEYYDDGNLVNKNLDFDLTLAMCPVDDMGGRFHLLGSPPFDLCDWSSYE